MLVTMPDYAEASPLLRDDLLRDARQSAQLIGHPHALIIETLVLRLLHCHF
jgi:hypothetical protein